MYLDFSIELADLFSYFSGTLVLVIVGLLGALGFFIYFIRELRKYGNFSFALWFCIILILLSLVATTVHYDSVSENALRQAAAAHNIQIMEPNLREAMNSTQREFHHISFMHIEDGRPGDIREAFFIRERSSITIVFND